MEFLDRLNIRDYRAVWLSPQKLTEYKDSILGLQSALGGCVGSGFENCEIYFQDVELIVCVDILQGLETEEYSVRVGRKGEEPSLVLQLPVKPEGASRDFILDHSEIHPKVFRDLASLLEW